MRVDALLFDAGLGSLDGKPGLEILIAIFLAVGGKIETLKW